MTGGKVRYLELDRLTTNPTLARHLPPELAFRYHALPVAEREGCLTIAMANPEDGVARAAVCRAVGMTPYLVKGDARTIDRLLAQMWPGQSPNVPHFLVIDPLGTDELWNYAAALSEQLGASLDRKGSARDLNQSGYDLIIMNKANWTHFWQKMVDLKEVQHPTSLLMARKPVWPLTCLLLVIRCNETCDAALNWIIELAKPARLAVTLQIITPPLPTIHYDGYIQALMSTNTEVGRWIQRVGQQFEQWQIPSTVKIRQGDPIWQLRQELAEGTYDLAVLAHRPISPWTFRDTLVGSLLEYAGCPVLISQR